MELEDFLFWLGATNEAPQRGTPRELERRRYSQTRSVCAEHPIEEQRRPK